MKLSKPMEMEETLQLTVLPIILFLDVELILVIIYIFFYFKNWIKSREGIIKQ